MAGAGNVSMSSICREGGSLTLIDEGDGLSVQAWL